MVYKGLRRFFPKSLYLKSVEVTFARDTMEDTEVVVFSGDEREDELPVSVDLEKNASIDLEKSSVPKKETTSISSKLMNMSKEILVPYFRACLRLLITHIIKYVTKQGKEEKKTLVDICREHESVAAKSVILGFPGYVEGCNKTLNTEREASSTASMTMPTAMAVATKSTRTDTIVSTAGENSELFDVSIFNKKKKKKEEED